jgi:hypothetical protein
MMGLGNLTVQALPVLACFFVRRPWIRLALGSLFLVEMTALSEVMLLSNYHNAPLLAFFIDWDYFLRKIPATARRLAPAAVGTGDWRQHKAAIAVSGVLMAFYCFIAVNPISPDIGYKIGSWPFSAHALFSEVRGERSFTHHSNTFAGCYVSFEIDGKGEDKQLIYKIEQAMNAAYHKRFRVKNCTVPTQQSVDDVYADIPAEYLPIARDRYSLNIYISQLYIPAYPQSPMIKVAKSEYIGNIVGGKVVMLPAAQRLKVRKPLYSGFHFGTRLF